MMKVWTSRAVLALVAAVGLSLVTPTLAAPHVASQSIDTTTRGDWRGTYGECFFLIPDPENPYQIPEQEVGPDWFGTHHEQYRYDNCYGGPLFDNNPALSKVDWRIFLNDPTTPGADNAFAFFFGPPEPPRPGSEQWNPCLGIFKATTWDNADRIWDPLSLELRLDVEGDVTVAYYFVDSDIVCRDVALGLSINGDAPKAFADLTDLADGKYLVFELEDVVPGTIIRLDASDLPGDPVCAAPAVINGLNSVIAGVFISGDACLPPGECGICGDGVLDAGEQCDDSNNDDGDGCSAECTIEPRCGDGNLDPGEQCDDGNSQNGDCCSASCTIEPGCGEDDEQACLACPIEADGKVTICHVPPGNPANARTIRVSPSALPAHCNNHGGDSCGACASNHRFVDFSLTPNGPQPSGGLVVLGQSGSAASDPDQRRGDRPVDSERQRF
jgi:cysteine-rich repeat protein